MAVLRCGFVCHRSSDGRGWRTGFTVVAGLGNIRANPLIFKGGIQPLHRTNINTERGIYKSVSYTHLRAHETRHDLVCRLLLEKKKKHTNKKKQKKIKKKQKIKKNQHKISI